MSFTDMELEEAVKIIVETKKTGHEFNPCTLCLSKEPKWCESNTPCNYNPSIECCKKYLWIKVRERIINKMKEIKK